MENPNTYFDAWMKSQQQVFATLREQATQMQSLYLNTAQNAAGNGNNPFDAWSKAAFAAFNSGSDADLAKDILSKSMDGTRAIQKLFEQWQPMFEAMRNSAADPDAYKHLLDPATIKQLVDQLFHFDLDAMAQLQKQAAQATAFYEQYGKPWLAAVQKGMANPSGDQHEAVLKSMQNMLSAFENSAGRVFGMPAVGKDREKMELMAQCAAAMSTYAARNSEYQHLMYQTGVEASQTLAKEVASKLQAGENMEKFDTFFALWIDVNEKTFNKLFQTKAFTQKRNALTDAGFKARKLYHELLENQLVDLPIARRSEMDELYKAVYELRKQVKNLEKKLANSNQQNKGASHE